MLDLGSQSAYPTITGSIFEFGFSDGVLQMWAAFLDEPVNQEAMRQPFRLRRGRGGVVTPAVHGRGGVAAGTSATVKIVG